MDEDEKDTGRNVLSVKYLWIYVVLVIVLSTPIKVIPCLLTKEEIKN